MTTTVLRGQANGGGVMKWTREHLLRLLEWVMFGPPECLDCGARLPRGQEFCSEEHRASYEENLPWK